MSLGKMSRWISVRRSSHSGGSVREDARNRRNKVQNQLLRHRSEGDIDELSNKRQKDAMRIIELKSSPGVVRRAAPSPARTPALEEHEEFSRTSPPSSGAPMAAPAADNTLDSLDEDLVEPGYALPSACNKSSSSSAFRTSTPLDGKIPTDAFAIAGSSASSPASTISTPAKMSSALSKQEKREALEDRAGGYDVVCLNDVRAVTASLPRMTSDQSLVDESVFTGPIHREDYLRKLGRRFKSWKRRWVVLHPTELSLFKTVNMISPSRVISTEEVVDVFYPASSPYPDGHSFEIVTNQRNHILATKSEGAARAWVHLIQRASGKTRRSASVQWLSGGRSSSQSGSPPGVNREIEPYAQAVVPRHRRTQQAEPTYAIASRASPTRRPSDPRPMPDGDCREVGDEDDAPPVPPKQFDSGEDDGDSSDDGEESKDILEIDVMRTPSVGNGHVAVGALSTAASMCSSRTLVGTCRDQVTLSLTNDGTTLDAPDDAEELGAVFF